MFLASPPLCRSALRGLPVVLLLLGLALASCRKPAPPTGGVAALPVKVASVTVRDQPVYLEKTGLTRGSQEVEVRARVDGLVEAIHFQEGKLVSAGDLLYSIDPKPLQAALEQAQGGLDQAVAALEKARLDASRAETLVASQAAAQKSLDDARSAEKAATAAVESARGAVESARLQLGYAQVTAPIAGLAGISEVQPGNLVSAGQRTLLTSISALDPIRVRISISEREYLDFVKMEPPGEARASRGRGVFELILADGQPRPDKGSVVYADRQVDPQTGTLLLEVEFANPGGVVRPGMYARVRFPREVRKGALLVPQRAVQERQATFHVVVVKSDQTAEFRPVVPGPRVGDQWIIERGLQAGESIVVEGLQKLRPGAPLAPSPYSPDGPAAAAR